MKYNDKIYCFTLILHDVSELTEELENQLYEAGCDDGLLFMKDRIAYIDFERESESLEEAILGAIEQIESTGVRVARAEPGDLVTSAEIARRLNRSRESVRLLIKGDRGADDFPLPLAGITTKTNIWSWVEVVHWFYKYRKIDDNFIVRKAEILKELNEALEARNRSYSIDKVQIFASRLSGDKPVHKIKH